MFRRKKQSHYSKTLLLHLFSLHKNRGKNKALIPEKIQANLHRLSKHSKEELFKEYKTLEQGLKTSEANRRLTKVGLNEILAEKPPSWFDILITTLMNPFVLLLAALSALSLLLKNYEAVTIISTMVFLSVLIRFIQEFRSNNAAEKLKALVSTKATIFRDNEEKQEISFKEIVPGDLISLSAGDMIPADVRLIYAHDLFISQSSLTGESTPIEKQATVNEGSNTHSLDLANIAFMGTNVVSGIGKGIVIGTGNETYFGSIARTMSMKRPLTNFDLGLNQISFLLIRLMLILLPIVFLINGFSKGEWLQSLLFALSLAVSLTPEMLPMIVTTNLAKGALNLAKSQVIVKHLNSIQNFGAMDILCTDKTGTLTENRVVLEQYLDLDGIENGQILKFAYLNSYYQSGLKNLLDEAILQHSDCQEWAKDFEKIDEIPFDFIRKRMSVVLQDKNRQRLIITKGAFESVLSISNTISIERKEKTTILIEEAKQLYEKLNQQGFRVLGLGIKAIPLEENITRYEPKEECNLTFIGFLVFLDPPKQSSFEAIEALLQSGVTIKVLTGDDLSITKYVAKAVGIEIIGTLTGEELEDLSEEERRQKVLNTTLFAKLSPIQKATIIQDLKSFGHTVGFLGDGINDAPALRESDIGISVDSAVDIAKESSDIIMLKNNLLLLKNGILEGRKTFANIQKYIKMTLSSNFGNSISILGASLFLPFLPMLPLQILLQNLLYDISQMAIPFDRVDQEYLAKPQQWCSSGLTKFMFCIGPISSIFDYITFFILWFIFKANDPSNQALFQSGWFMEGLLSQVLIVHMIRTAKIPFIQSFPSWSLFLSTLSIAVIGLIIPYSSIGHALEMVPPPSSYLFSLFSIIFAYCLLMQGAKKLFIRRFKEWL